MDDDMRWQMTTTIVSAFVAHNPIPADALTELMREVHGAIENAHAQVPLARPTFTHGKEPAVAIKKSVFPNYLICLEDGKRLKLLKRYLMRNFGLTPDQYRERWNLPPEYPMAAASWTDHRREVAKRSGLGQRRKKETVVGEDE